MPDKTSLIIAPDSAADLSAVPSNRDYWLPRLKQWNAIGKRFTQSCEAIEPKVENEAELSEMRAQARASLRELNDIRLAATKPYRDAAKKINDKFKVVEHTLADGEDALNRSIRVVIHHKREAEARARAEREAKHTAKMERLKAEALERMESEPSQIDNPDDWVGIDENEREAVESPLARTQIIPVRKVVVDDIAKLPRQYLTPNMAKIKRDALDGVEIPGVRVTIQDVTRTTITPSTNQQRQS